jgi:hypothetical protein
MSGSAPPRPAKSRHTARSLHSYCFYSVLADAAVTHVTALSGRMLALAEGSHEKLNKYI